MKTLATLINVMAFSALFFAYESGASVEKPRRRPPCPADLCRPAPNRRLSDPEAGVADRRRCQRSRLNSLRTPNSDHRKAAVDQMSRLRFPLHISGPHRDYHLLLDEQSAHASRLKCSPGGRRFRPRSRTEGDRDADLAVGISKVGFGLGQAN